jgi:hypothetical protein
MFSAASKSASGGTLTVQTFTANGTWTAPPTVSNVVRISGRGSDGVSDYIANVDSGFFGALQGSSGLANAPFAQWGTIYSAYQTGLANLSLSYPTYGPSSYLQSSNTFIGPDDRWVTNDTTGNLSSVYLTGFSTNQVGSPQTSGNATYSSVGAISGWLIINQGYVQGNAGTASTGLGKTFPGGSYTGSYPNGVGGAAPTTEFNNVAVTPGASYSIVVPSGGSVSITYIG